MQLIEGFKFVRKDGTTHNGYQWPLPTNGKPVKVKADPGGREFTTKDPCPQFEGDGLCVALTAHAASSGGVKASEAIGLWLTYKPSDILAQGDGKCRVKAVTVTGIFDVTAWVRTMCAGANLSRAYLSRADLSRADLSGAYLSRANLSRANLSGANLYGADLYGADLSGAYLSRAYLSRADLSGANLSGADLYGADLSGAYLSGAYLSRANLSRANLSGADLYGADLSGAYLSGAYLSRANLSRAYGRDDWDALVARGAIR
jgi:hypothetical protein